MSEAKQILNRYWGYDNFRPFQEEVVESVMLGKDTLAILPTGAGKSICYQVPAIAMEGICIVISPLIALMKDQVLNLKKRGVNCHAVYASMSKREVDIVLDNCVYGDVKVLLVSPERLKSELFQVRVVKMKVSFICVDEAHCISEWGHDFRPAYREIAHLKELVGQKPVLALTASATKEVRRDIIDSLELREPTIFKGGFERENLVYKALETENKDKHLLDLLESRKGQSGIVYVNTRRNAKSVTHMLIQKGYKADIYHAGLPMEKRNQKQDAWIKGETKVIVATNAFGMGIDKPDVRFVAHYDVPRTLEAYYQEAGRAGRDGNNATAIVFYNEQDFIELRAQIDKSFPEVKEIKRVYQALANYYKLAVGSHELISFEFEMHDFCETYKLNLLNTHYALEVLQSLAIVKLSDPQKQFSQVLLNISHHDLYQFQVANVKYDALIKIVLRQTGGEVFNTFKKIDEKALGKLLDKNEHEIEKLLTDLHQKEVLVYDKKSDNQKITFIQPRYNAEELPIKTLEYQNRKKKTFLKLDEMIRYCINTYQCRSQFICNYFDDHKAHKCGNCDVCMKGESVFEGKMSEDLRKVILNKLGKEAISIEEIFRGVDKREHEKLLVTLRQMIDMQEVKYTDTGKLIA